jgi:hypothetical protein
MKPDAEQGQGMESLWDGVPLGWSPFGMESLWDKPIGNVCNFNLNCIFIVSKKRHIYETDYLLCHSYFCTFGPTILSSSLSLKSTIMTTPPIRRTAVLWMNCGFSNWFTPGNWADGQLPVASTVVTLPAGRTNYPIVTGSGAICYQLLVEPGADFEVVSGAILTVTGE